MSRIYRWFSSKRYDLLFIFTVVSFFSYIYRGLFSGGMINIGDYVPWTLNQKDLIQSFIYSWTQRGLGNMDLKAGGMVINQLFFTYLFRGNISFAQRFYYLSLMPISAFTMYICLGFFINSKLSRFFCSFFYSINGITIVFFQWGGIPWLEMWAAFPLFILYFIKSLGNNRQLYNILLFTFIVAFTSNNMIYFLFQIMPFMIIFGIVEFMYRRNLIYSIKTIFLFSISFFVIGLILAPLLTDMIIKLFRYYTFNITTFGLYSETPIDTIINATYTIYAHPITVMSFNRLTFLIFGLSLSSLFVKHKTNIKHYLCFLLVAIITQLSFKLLILGLFSNIFVLFPFLLVFRDPIKLIAIIAWAIFMMMAILVDDIGRRFNEEL